MSAVCLGWRAGVDGGGSLEELGWSPGRHPGGVGRHGEGQEGLPRGRIFNLSPNTKAVVRPERHFIKSSCLWLYKVMW